MEQVIKMVQVISCIAFFSFLGGCAAMPIADEEKSDIKVIEHPFTGDPDAHKDIFVFLDGTANNPTSGTNVWRLFDLIIKDHAPQMTAIYIEGVGSIYDMPVTGKILGRGMENRMLKGYEFIAKNYSPDDQIYIFGFSRGAHQARSLAGLIAYAGIPIISGDGRDSLMHVGNRIIELTKKKSDEDYLEKWISWQPGQPPLLAKEINGELGYTMQSAEITFLGVWDTVPGSSLKNYGYCKEKKGFVKKYLYWLIPGVDHGERYKTDSYPPIHKIVHGVSLDEKRSKFAPLCVCPAINATFTEVNEMWFAGAHADVGGGYEDSRDLPGISLNWMIGILAENYKFTRPIPKVPEDPQGLAHWSIFDKPANMGSICEERYPPQNAKIHQSFYEREKGGPMPVRINGEVKYLKYPLDCSFN